MENEIKIVRTEGYHDGWYWDIRTVFDYKGKRFVVLDVGSYSGYISKHGAIAYLEEDNLLKDWVQCFEVEVKGFEPEQLKDFADRLIESGEICLVLWDEDEDI